MAYAPHDAREEVAAAAPDGLEPFAQAEGHVGARLQHAFAEAARRGGGRPVLLVGTDMPLLGERHAWSACDDLVAGVDVTYGPATDGGYYLVGARAPHPALFAIDPKAWGGPTVMTRSLDAALAAGLRVAWLRSERPLDQPADVRALLADPCAPRDVTDVLAAFSSRAPGP